MRSSLNDKKKKKKSSPVSAVSVSQEPFLLFNTEFFSFLLVNSSEIFSHLLSLISFLNFIGIRNIFRVFWGKVMI